MENYEIEILKSLVNKEITRLDKIIINGNYNEKDKKIILKKIKELRPIWRKLCKKF